MASGRVPSNLESHSPRFKKYIYIFTVNLFFYDQGLKLFFGPFYQQPLTVNPIKTFFGLKIIHFSVLYPCRIVLYFIGAKNNKNRSLTLV